MQSMNMYDLVSSFVMWLYGNTLYILAAISIVGAAIFLPLVVQNTSPAQGTVPAPTLLPTLTPTSTDGEVDIPSPLAAWTFQEGAGTTAEDTSGHGYTATLNGPTWTIQGHEDSALAFDGRDDSVRIDNLNASGEQFTLAALIQADGFDHLSSRDARIISKATGVNEQDHYWMLSTILADGTIRLRFRLKADGVTRTLIADAGGTISPGVWIHVAAVYDGSAMTLYKNGAVVGSVAHSGPIDQNEAVATWIGDNPPTVGSRPWDGVIDDVYLFEASLSPEQIRTLIPTDLVDMPPPVSTPVPTSQPGAPTPTAPPSAGAFEYEEVANDDGRTAIGDINGDGFNDIVVHEWGSNRGQKADGSLTWYAYPDWMAHVIQDNTSFFGDAVVIHDLDRDGDQDVVTTRGNDNSAEIWWYENPGGLASSGWTEHFVAQVEAESEIKDLEIADMDQDSLPDIVSRTKHFLAVYYQDDPATWFESQVGNEEREGMALGDLDGDGDEDVIFNGYWRENEGGRTSSWPRYNIAAQWYNDSTGGWQDHSVSVDTGDINGDGHLDVAFSHSEKSGFPVTWYANMNPQGGESGWIAHPITVVDYAHSLQIADFNNDGQPDILSGTLKRSNPPHIYAMYNQNNGSSWDIQIIADKAAYKAAVGDIDNDEDIDIVSAWSWEDSPIQLFRNRLDSAHALPLEQWQRHQIDTLNTKAVFVAAHDLNGDGRKDLIAGQWWWANPGSVGGNWGDARAIGAPFNNFATAGDFDHDGDVDLFGTQGRGAAVNHNLAWAENDSAGNFTIHTNIQTGGSGDFLQGVVRADFGQGDQIALSWHNGGGGVQAVTIPAQPASQSWPFVTLSTTTQQEDLSAGDIDRDGDLDLLLGTRWLENQNGGSTWADHALGAVPVGTEPDRNDLVDVNGDGRLDAVVALELGTDLFWYEAGADPTQPWTRHAIGVVAGQGFSMDTADFDGDGDADVVVGEHRGNPTNRVLLFANQDGGSTWPLHVIDADASSTIDHHDGTQAVDLDNDGDFDLISIGWNNPKIWVFENGAQSPGP